jgi:hypothetical protein
MEGSSLCWIKVLHTVIWVVFVGLILAVPVAAGIGDLGLAVWLSLAVWVEVLVLALNGMHCPLTNVAARYTRDRSDNFDIFLPAWLARYNQVIFGSIFAAAELFLLRQWLARNGM